MHVAKTAGILDTLRGMADAPSAIAARKSLEQAARESAAAHAAEHAASHAVPHEQYAAQAAKRLASERAAATRDYAKSVPPGASAAEAKAALLEARARHTPAHGTAAVTEKTAGVGSALRGFGARVQDVAGNLKTKWDVSKELRGIQAGNARIATQAGHGPEAIAAAGRDARLEAARRVASRGQHGGHLGSVMPTPGRLNALYGHVQPSDFEHVYGQSLGATGKWGKFRGRPTDGRTFLTQTPKGARVSDAGRAYLHADGQMQASRAIAPTIDSSVHEAASVQGGSNAIANGWEGLDIHGRPASDEIAEGTAHLATPRNESHARINAAVDAADARARGARPMSPMDRARAAASDAQSTVASRRRPAAAEAPGTVPARGVRRPAPASGPGSLASLFPAATRPARAAGAGTLDPRAFG